MITLSSNKLFYRAVASLVIVPILISIFIQVFLTGEKSLYSNMAIYLFLLAIVIQQGYMMFKYRQVSYNNNSFVFKNYCNDKAIEVAFDSIIKIEKNSTLGRSYSNMSYKIEFWNNYEENTIYFFKNVELSDIDDLETYVGLRQ